MVISKKASIYVVNFGNPENLGTGIVEEEAVKKLIDSGTAEIQFQKYQIKETDMRIKTATFTSPQLFDLTNKIYAVYIISDYHENFGGVILKAEYDPDNDLYSYTCQDWSRKHMVASRIITTADGEWNVYNLIIGLLTEHNKAPPFPESLFKEKAELLSGLRAIEDYKQKPLEDKPEWNPMETKVSAVFEGKKIELIRQLVYQNGALVDVWYDMYGRVHIDPLDLGKWLTSGIYLTTMEMASWSQTFDTTNVVTEVKVLPSETLGEATKYTSKDLIGVDLSKYFGKQSTLISLGQQNQQNASTSNGLGISTSTPIMIDTDNIYGRSSDAKMLNDCASVLRSKGYNVTIGGIGPNYHVSDVNRCPQNGCLMVIYGGLCAGTFVDMASTYYQNMMKKRNIKVVVGITGPAYEMGMRGNKEKHLDNLTWLPRAWDDNFSGISGLSNPGKYLKDHGFNYIYGKDGTDLGNQFAGGTGTITNTTASTSNANTDNSVVDNNSASYVVEAKKKALQTITQSIRDLLSFKVKFPLNSKIFKNVHTNQFMWTELPNKLKLKNYAEIVNGLATSELTRYSGYRLNAWYIESTTVTYDDSNFTMECTLNPFPSSYSTYTNAMEQAVNKYTQATQQNNNNGEGSTATGNIPERTDGCTDCSTSIDIACNSSFSSIRGQQNKVENANAYGRIGRTGTNYAEYVKGCTPKEAYKKLAQIFNYRSYVKYYDNADRCASDTFNKRRYNCGDGARLLKACMDVLGQPCVIYTVPGHYMNGVLINGKWETVDLCYQSGSHPEYQTAGWNK